MRTYGKVHHVIHGLGSDLWGIHAEPQVVVRLKALFPKIAKSEHGWQHLSNTTENARDLAWFLQRYPMEMTPEDRAFLELRSAEHDALIEKMGAIARGDYAPREFSLSYPPRQYQAVAAEMVLQGRSLLLADELGVGKTLVGIMMLTDPRTRPALVVTLTALPKQWMREIHKFAPGMRVHVLKSGQPYDLTVERRRKVPFPDVIVTSYSKLVRWSDVLAGVVKGIVWDEVQELRIAGSDKYRSAQNLAEKADFILGMSATPIFNYGGEIHNVMNCIRPGALGHRDEFLREWCVSSGSYSGEPSIKDPKAFGRYARETGFMLRRTRKDVGRELPALTVVPHEIDCDAHELEKVAFSASELARFILRRNTTGFAKMKAAEELSWVLRQATGIAKAPYVAEFVRILVDSGEKVLLFGWHRAVYDIWAQRLKDLYPVFYTGSESSPQKDAAMQAFTKGDSRVMVMSLRAGAGLDGLQHACRTVVTGELDWSSGVHEQNIGRVYRDGQSDPVTAYTLWSNSGADPAIMEVLGAKLQQLTGIRDPDKDIIEKLQLDPQRIMKLAESYLEQRGLHRDIYLAEKGLERDTRPRPRLDVLPGFKTQTQTRPEE